MRRETTLPESPRNKEARLLPALHLDGFDGSCSRLGIQVTATDFEWLEIVVEVIDEALAANSSFVRRVDAAVSEWETAVRSVHGVAATPVQ